MTSIEGQETPVKKKAKGASVWGSIAFTAIFAFLMLAAGWEFRPRYETVTEHHVEVLRQVSANQWAMRSAEQGVFLYTGCPDFPNAGVIWAGYIADHAKWEERGACKSIRRPDLGFWWERDKDYNVRTIQ